MKSFFDGVTRLSLRFRAVTLASIVVVMLLGAIAGTQLKQELLPPIAFPQTFILAQVSGMTSEQVLTVVTERLEAEIAKIPEIVNLTSTSTGAFGAVITAANDFGLNQQRLSADIQAAIDRVWFPGRSITPPDGANPQAFAATLLNEMPADVLIYLAQKDPNFAFQLSPQVWEKLSDEALSGFAAYLARQTTAGATKTALERLIDQEIVPQLLELSQVADVSISGGQMLPGENGAASSPVSSEERSLALQLSPEVWDIISQRILKGATQNDNAAAALAQLPLITLDGVPALPDSWRFPLFTTADDLAEMQSLTRSVAGVFNSFAESGVIKGALGTTSDLSPDDVRRMLEIDPTLIEAFNAEQLAALPEEVFAELPADYLNNLDGLTRDSLAAYAVARSLTGDFATEIPLPSQWRVQPPQIITFNLSSIPLATFSVFDTTVSSDVAEVSVASPQPVTPPAEAESTPSPDAAPALPRLYQLLGGAFGANLNTAADLVEIRLGEQISQQLGVSEISAADFLNQLALLDNAAGLAASGVGGEGIDIAAFVSALPECGIGLLDIDIQNPNIPAIVIGCLPADVFAYIQRADENFVASLNEQVFAYLSDDVLGLEGVSPPLPAEWNTLLQQPQFAQTPLRSYEDFGRLVGGDFASAINTLVEEVPSQFAGYEVRLIDSISTVGVEHILRQQPDFFDRLSEAALLKLSPEVLALVPDETLNRLPEETQRQVIGIRTSELQSAAAVLSANEPPVQALPGDPNAPALDPIWNVIASNAPGIDQLVNAGDLIRLPEEYGGVAAFFDTLIARAGDFGRQAIGSLDQAAFDYISKRETDFVDNLTARVLSALNPEIVSGLPAAVQARLTGGEAFIPTNRVTRTNGASSLLVTITKDQNANTVEAFYLVKDVIDKIDQANENISVAVAFEQSSFVEESIAGVVREGTLGAFFAILIILVFLSGGTWNANAQRITGFVVLALFGTLFIALLASQLGAGATLAEAWDNSDPIIRVILIGGIVVGALLLTWRGHVPRPAWRSTLVIAVSIPLSIFAALALMRWFPSSLHGILAPLAESSPVFAFLLRLAPKDLTLNIMTLSGLTVAVGRVVDDSIVVLENIFRQIQSGSMSKREAILSGSRDVSVAIFSATCITVIVFLPLGLTGGLIGEFFLPFGLAVTYALLTSFVVAITVIPVLVELFVTDEEAQEEEMGGMQQAYTRLLGWSLKTPARRYAVVAAAVLSALAGVLLFANRPQAFIPEFGEPQISITLELPAGTGMVETNQVALRLESLVREIVPEEDLQTISTIVGGGGLSLASLTGGNSISENRASITVGVRNSESLEALTQELRSAAIAEVGEQYVTVSKATLTSQGGFGGFELVMSGADQAQLEQLENCVTKALNKVEGVANVTSNLAQTGLSLAPCPTVVYSAAYDTGGDIVSLVEDAVRGALTEKAIVTVQANDRLVVEVSTIGQAALAELEPVVLEALKAVPGLRDVRLETAHEEQASGETSAASGVLIRINQQAALSFTGEVETQDTINLATRAIAAVEAQLSLPQGVELTQGYNSEFQQEGFSGIFVAMGIALVIVVAILVVVFGSPVYWFAVIFSIIVAPVGASIALTLADRTLGISALIGLLMLLGLVVTNAVVLIDRVSSNRRERGMNLYDALLEAGGRRLRPILMTALATIIALTPLALGLSEGAIIAEELGTVVIGGLISSTLLTLIVVPVVYYLITPLHRAVMGNKESQARQTTGEG